MASAQTRSGLRMRGCTYFGYEQRESQLATLKETVAESATELPMDLASRRPDAKMVGGMVFPANRAGK